MNKLERRDFVLGLVALGAARGLLPPGVAEAARVAEPTRTEVRRYRLVLEWYREYEAMFKWEEVGNREADNDGSHRQAG